MDNPTLAGLLAAVPPADLRIIELTAELTRTDGGLDLGRGGGPSGGGGTCLYSGPGLRRRHEAAAGGNAVEAAAPPVLSGLAQMLLRRPPSLQELVTLVGYAEDYAWFAGLVRRLFPQEATDVLAAQEVLGRVERFAQLFQERHFPLYTPFLEFWLDEGEEPPWSWLRRGIPFDLMGFGYDDLHEMWDGYREGLSALALLAQPPDSFFMEPDGIRTALAGVGRPAHPAERPAPHSPRRRTHRIPDRSRAGNGVPGGCSGRCLGLEPDRQLLSRP